MRKFIITISRQCGSGGHTIGEKLAERLKVPLYDKKILKIVAERSGLAEETIATIGEYANAKLLYMIASNMFLVYNVSDKRNMPLHDQVNAFQTELIKELAEKESCIIIGRCADYILRGCSDALHIFIHADSKDRCRRVVAEHGIDEKEAASRILERD